MVFITTTEGNWNNRSIGQFQESRANKQHSDEGPEVRGKEEYTAFRKGHLLLQLAKKKRQITARTHKNYTSKY